MNLPRRVCDAGELRLYGGAVYCIIALPTAAAGNFHG